MTRIHPTAEVSERASIGEGSQIWNWAQIRDGARIGSETIVGKSAYVDSGVRIGSRVKIQNNVSIYHGVEIEDGVFLGPHVCFTNDRLPRAINPDGSRKSEDDWEVAATHVRYGSSIGANTTVVAGVTIGRFALIGAGSVVTHDIPDFALAYGTPARVVAMVCLCGNRTTERGPNGTFVCEVCRDAVGDAGQTPPAASSA